MRLLFIVDGRSPIALNWISYFVEKGHEVHLVSTIPCAPSLEFASINILPVAFSSAGVQTQGHETVKGGAVGKLREWMPMSLRTFIRQWLGPLTVPRTARKLRPIINVIQPDLIHAMRIPFEGILAAKANPQVPLLISVWGNDFTLHAAANPLIARYTRQTLRRIDALQTDAKRDLKIAYDWGFDQQKPILISPGAGGIRGDIFYPPIERATGSPIIINPRGYRTYIRNDTFFQAIPLVLERYPEACFFCPDMDTELEAHQWVEKLGIGHAVELLPRLPHHDMADLLRKAHIAVSPSTHDGTPNSLLEAIACGCFPIAGDIESLREWIIPGTNGTLFDPLDPQALAQAILDAIENDQFRQQALDYNQNMITERAAYNTIMAKVQTFYQDIINAHT